MAWIKNGAGNKRHVPAEPGGKALACQKERALALLGGGNEHRLVGFTCFEGLDPIEAEVREWNRAESRGWFVHGRASEDTRVLIVEVHLDQDAPLAA